jgi:UDPglucose 6-dehydrogenase
MRVAVIGLGKLGAPLAAVLASCGHSVVGVDVNPAAVEALNAGRAPVTEPGLQARLDQAGGRLRATTDIADAILATDISFVIVPTPSGPDGTFTNRFVLDAVRKIGASLRGGRHYHVVNITSTVMPGSTGGEIRAALEEASGLVVGEGVGLTYNPEFIALGTVVRDLLHPDMVLIGESDTRAGDVLAGVYSLTVPASTPVQRMNWVSAELTKIAVNTFVTTKISYANMIAEMCERLPGADANVVTRALGHDSRIGPRYLTGALGYGGPCFPRDNVALAALARTLGLRADLAEATDAVNRRQVDRVVSLARRLAAPGDKVAVLGLSYKPDTPVVEESQGLMIARALAATGHPVLVSDPVALDSAMQALGTAVDPMRDAQAAVARAAVVVVTTPDRHFAALPAGCFAGKTVIDCWRILPDAVADVADVVHLGRGSTANRVLAAAQ